MNRSATVLILLGINFDSNVSLRFLAPEDSRYPVVRRAIDWVLQQGHLPAFTARNLVEFWNVCSQPGTCNGFGLSIPDTLGRVEVLEANFRFLPDLATTHHHWRRLVVAHAVSGVQAHDARLVAAMFAHGLTHLLTFNSRDFARYDGITILNPEVVIRLT